MSYTIMGSVHTGFLFKLNPEVDFDTSTRDLFLVLFNFNDSSLSSTSLLLISFTFHKKSQK